MNETLLVAPSPVLDKKEREAISQLDKKYEKLVEPSALATLGRKVISKIPDQVVDVVKEAGKTLSEQDLVKQALKIVGEGFADLEKGAAKVTVNEKTILTKVNKVYKEGTIDSLKELCFVREYDIANLVKKYKVSDRTLALVEGGATGAFGFAGLVPNIVLSTFLYFRAVQSIAMYYGYDVKNDDAEMEIAASVLMSALDPNQNAVNNELTAAIGKFMIFTETTAIRQASAKTWTEMASRGGLSLLITQIRALSNAAAKKALANANKKGLEKSIFSGILEQLGKKFGLKSAGEAMPVIGGIVGGLFDTTQMKHITDYADIFYRKRFIQEKELRINALINPNSEGSVASVIDVEDIEITDDN